MSDRCPNPEALAEAYAGAGTLAVHQHVDRCESCAAQWRGYEELSALGRELPRASPAPARVEQLRTLVLAAAQKERRPTVAALPWRAARTARWAAPLALAASLLAVLAVRSGGPESSHRGRVQAANGARLTHTRAVLADGSADEVVRLTDGRLRVAVDPLRGGERFRVRVGNAELEVRGTEFDVAAEQDQLTSVLVHEGTVVVRPRGGAEVILTKGQRWAPTPVLAVLPAPAPVALVGPEPVAAAPSAPVVKSRPRRSAALVAPQPAVPPLPLPAKAGLLGGATEEAFAEGWQALREGDAAAAARSFDRAAQSAPDTALAEDARFWEAVALARAGNRNAAASAMGSFLDRYPANPRAAELSAMLGWILLDAGRLADAKARFMAALADPSPKVRQSAEAGLLELDGR